MSTREGVVYLGIFDSGHALNWSKDHEEYHADSTYSCQCTKHNISGFHIYLSLALEFNENEKIAEKHAVKRKRSIKTRALKH